MLTIHIQRKIDTIGCCTLSKRTDHVRLRTRIRQQPLYGFRSTLLLSSICLSQVSLCKLSLLKFLSLLSAVTDVGWCTQPPSKKFSLGHVASCRFMCRKGHVCVCVCWMCSCQVCACIHRCFEAYLSESPTSTEQDTTSEGTAAQSGMMGAYP